MGMNLNFKLTVQNYVLSDDGSVIANLIVI